MLQGFCGKRIPLCGKNWADSIRPIVSATKWPEFVALFVGDCGSEVLHLNQSLAHEDNLGDFGNAGHLQLAVSLHLQHHLAFVLILGKAERFRCGKQVASYLGLVPLE